MRHATAVVGSRTYPALRDLYDQMTEEEQNSVDERGRKYVAAYFDNLTPSPFHTIISGGAKGVDSWAAEIASERGFPVVEIRPNWKKYGKGAGFRRNKEIVLAADEVVAFWDGSSAGTLHTVKQAEKLQRPLLVFGGTGELIAWATEEDYKGEEPLLSKMLKARQIIT